ncbi:hypothetical protein M5K25_026093 [Dendrobium thyrsiflorum]|uniref:Reverse transcriptase zinc-binding domain-containing protein n=1 Tax=Dendrobium thyrsiflorum TaxID=117978 RepID=A0ABD0TWK1_DENTH
MDSMLSSLAFPPLPSSQAGASPPVLRNWANILDAQDPCSEENIPLSHFPSEPEIVPFSDSALAKGAQDWSFCLVGYSIGRRPFYEALLGAMGKTWKLKGSFQLLSLSEGFFLLRFSTVEDFDMVWNKGIWFLLGRPFVLQKWHPRFRPKRENFSSVPIWIKIHDLPLACWNSDGISRIASKVGIPLAVDSLTAKKTRLTFARVCVQVDSDATYPEEIPISLDGDIFGLKVQYEWKPSPCETCKSLVHSTSFCPLNNPPTQPNPAAARGRSSSRKPRRRTPSQKPNGPALIQSLPQNTTKQPQSAMPILPTPPNPNIQFPESTNAKIPPSPTDPVDSPNVLITTSPQNSKADQLPSSHIIPSIPNLNVPTEEASSSTSASSGSPLSKHPAVISPNKFEILVNQEDPIEDPPFVLESENQTPEPSNHTGPISQSKKTPRVKNLPPIAAWNIRGFNSSDKVFCCKNFVSKFRLDMLCLLENRIHPSAFSNPFFDITHSVFSPEQSCNNFHLSNSGRIWIKWNPNKLNFTPSLSTTQIISGMISSPTCPPFQLSVIYASNSSNERLELWNYIRSITPSNNTPWIIIGDFNCCRFVFSKPCSGNPISDLYCKLRLLKKGIKSNSWASSRNIQAHLDNLHSSQRSKISDFMPLMDAIRKKMSGWKASLLSLAGRLQFLKFTILNSIAYWIRGSILPKTVYKFIKKCSSAFLFFGDTEANRKLRMVSWDKVCKPKNLGGLGIHSISAIQFAYNCSVIFRMYNGCSPLAAWLKIHYTSPWKPVHPHASPFWKELCKVAAGARNSFHFSITPSSPLSFYWDPWCRGQSIANLLQSPIADHNKEVQDYTSSGNWALPLHLPDDIADMIKSILINASPGPCLLWNNLKVGSFSHYTKEFYSSLTPSPWYHLIWHKRSVLKFSVFTWLSVVGGLKTADALISRNIPVNPECILCSSALENTSHLFFECNYSFSILTKLIPFAHTFFLRPNILQLLEWINDQDPNVRQLYFLITCCSIYFIWKERNGRRFGGNFNCTSSTVLTIKKAVFSKVSNWKNSELLLALL